MTCEWCGQMINPKRVNYAQNPDKYCSRDCELKDMEGDDDGSIGDGPGKRTGRPRY